MSPVWTMVSEPGQATSPKALYGWRATESRPHYVRDVAHVRPYCSYLNQIAEQALGQHAPL
jgi:hypothetical protein